MDKVVDHLLVFHGNAQIQDFPGNYTQYREWKAVEDKKESSETKISVRQQEAPPRKKRPEENKKLSFKEKQEFEVLEQQIEQLETEKDRISEELSSGNLSTEELMNKSNRLSKLIDLIDEKTMRWLELSDRDQ